MNNQCYVIQILPEQSFPSSWIYCASWRKIYLNYTLSSYTDMLTHANSTLHNPITLTFDPRVNACRVVPQTAIMHVSFGVQSQTK